MEHLMLMLARWKMSCTSRSFAVSTTASPTTVTVTLCSWNGGRFTDSWLLYPEDKDNEGKFDNLVKMYESDSGS